MKKSIIVGVIIFFIIILLAIVASILVTDKVSIKNDNEYVNDIYNKYPTDVDEAVNIFMSSEEYNKMSKDNQIKIMGDLLNIYKQNSVIKNLYYDETGLMYTFTYNTGNIKGALGGVMLKTWNPMMN